MNRQEGVRCQVLGIKKNEVAENSIPNTQNLIPNTQHCNLVLIGFMGVGKSRIGKMCARRLGYAFRDSDAVIEARVGCPVAEFFAREGEAAFREIERQAIAELSALPRLVIATGGGAALNPENVANLRATGLIVLLSATPETILRRVGNAQSRPLLANSPNPLARIREMLAQRTPCYERAAHHTVITTRRTPGQVVNEVLGLFTG